MSVGPDPQVSLQLIEETRRKINRLFEEVARLSDQDLPPTDYYGEVLKRVLDALQAPAGAVWVRTAQGNLQLQYQINLRQVGFDKTEESRQSHDELLRQAFQQGKPMHVPPQASAGPAAGGTVAPGNPTDYIVLLAPILVDKQAAGVIEVWQDRNRHPDAIQGFLQFLVRMTELCSLYTRNHLLRQMGGQQQLWTQLEAFARQIHASLNPTEVAYIVANEGRRLIQCDRVSIAVRHGKRTTVEAVSGADVVEKRSNLIQLMRKLFDSVIAWGEKLVYSGTKDDSLPPDVLAALDAYLEESNSKLLAIVPLRDEREGEESKKPVRSALLMECFEPNAAPEQLIARVDVVGRHATSALYNAVEHRRIPFRFIWQPLAKVQEGLGGKARAIMTLIAVGLLLLVAVLTFVPYQLKMDANGQLLPEMRRLVYAPGQEGRIEKIYVKPGESFPEYQDLMVLGDVELQRKLIEIKSEIDSARQNISTWQGRFNDSNTPQSERTSLQVDINKAQATLAGKSAQLDELTKQASLDSDRPGYFRLKAPAFPPSMSVGTERPEWTVLNSDFREKLLNKSVKPSEPLLRLGYKGGAWEIELKIPQKHIGQVLAAFDKQEKDGKENADILDVDLLVKSEPTHAYKGKLHRDKVGGEAKRNETDQSDPEPYVLAYVRIDGDDIPAANRIPRSLLVTGTEVHAKVRCGRHAMGYSLFYGVWEFLYEKTFLWF